MQEYDPFLLRRWPISRRRSAFTLKLHNAKTPYRTYEYEFIMQTGPVTRQKALSIAEQLQEQNPGYQYRLYDCRK